MENQHGELNTQQRADESRTCIAGGISNWGNRKLLHTLHAESSQKWVNLDLFN